jgi:Cu-Zn family superoxide dismutase
MTPDRRFVFGGVVLGTLALVGVQGATLAQSAHLARAASDGAAMAVLRNPAGDEVGKLTFTERDAKVLVRAMAHDLPPEFHGFHVHATGTCTAPDFTSAGGHYNPASHDHPSHAGDLPTLLVNQDGTAQVAVTTDRFHVADLLAGAGTAVIVHAGRDNQANIPTRYAPAPDATTLGTGDAGARIACGVIQAAGDENNHDDGDQNND